VKLKSNWESFALCKKDDIPSRWLSSNIDDINYAKNICRKCTVRFECLTSALTSEQFVGVNAGLSEYDFLNKTWMEARSVEENNWPRTDKVIRTLFREIA
jgi:hypothetical protein